MIECNKYNNGAHVCWRHASFIIFSVSFSRKKRQHMFGQKDDRSFQRLLHKKLIGNKSSVLYVVSNCDRRKKRYFWLGLRDIKKIMVNVYRRTSSLNANFTLLMINLGVYFIYFPPTPKPGSTHFFAGGGGLCVHTVQQKAPLLWNHFPASLWGADALSMLKTRFKSLLFDKA